MITFTFQDLADLRERLVKPKLDNITKGEEWKIEEDVHRWWYVPCGVIPLFKPLKDVRINFYSNGSFYSGNAFISIEGLDEKIQIPQIEGSVGDSDSRLILFNRRGLFGITRRENNVAEIYFGNKGTARRDLLLENEFKMDLERFAGLIGEVVNVQYSETNSPDMQYFLNPD